MTKPQFANGRTLIGGDIAACVMPKRKSLLGYSFAQAQQHKDVDAGPLDCPEHQGFAIYPVVNTTTFRPEKLFASFEQLPNDAALTCLDATTDQLSLSVIRDAWLQQMCLTAKACADPTHDRAVMTVSVTGGDIVQDVFMASLKQALLAADLTPSRMELAFPEATFMGLNEVDKARLEELHLWGIRLAVSNFGATSASLAFLEHFSPETIYLDESFAQRLSTPLIKPHYPMAIIRGLLAIAEDLDVTVIARGVRGTDEMRLLRELGCEVQQGPLFGTIEKSKSEEMCLIDAKSSYSETLKLTN